MQPMSVTGPSPIDTGPRGPSRTTGVTGLSHDAPCSACRAARSARVITPSSVGGRMKAVSDPLELRLQHLADLSDDELAAAYTPEREPWLRVNFVSTVDGAATGRTGSAARSTTPPTSGSSTPSAGARTAWWSGRARSARRSTTSRGCRSSWSAGPPTSRRRWPRRRPGRVLMATLATSDGLAAGAREAGRGQRARPRRGADRPRRAQGRAGRARLDRAAVRGRAVAVRRHAGGRASSTSCAGPSCRG